MAIDQREWWIRRLRRSTGYVEKAPWRVNIGRRQRGADWARLARRGLLFVFVLVLVFALLRYGLRR